MKFQRADLEFIKCFFHELRQNNIVYCIMRNAHEVADGDAHDVDMCIQDSCLAKAEQILMQQAEQQGWKLHLKTGSTKDKSNIKCYNYYYIEPNTKKIYIVHIDIFPTYAWKGFELLSNKTLLTDIQEDTIYHAIAPETEAVCNLFVRLLYNGKIKEKYKPAVLEIFRCHKQRCIELMQNFLKPNTADYVYNCVISEKWDDINNARKNIVRDTRKKSRRSIVTYFSYLLSKALNRKGLIVAFQGTDGSGKTTIINGLPEILGNTFSNNTLNYYHWRPGILKPENKSDKDGKPIVNTQPHLLPPYGKVLSCIKMLFYTADYILGYWLKVYWQAAQGHLVVFDRYYYDFYMDKRRYRLNTSDKLIRFLHHFIPEPDMTFVLLGDAAKIHARKNELSLEEVENQINTLLHYKDRFKKTVVIDVCQSIKDVLFEVSKNILELLHSKA